MTPTISTAGIYTLTITNNDNGCTSTDNIEVTGDTIEPTADAGDPAEIDCDNSAVELDASSSSQGNNFSYEWATSDGNILSGIDTLIAEVDELFDVVIEDKTFQNLKTLQELFDEINNRVNS